MLGKVEPAHEFIVFEIRVYPTNRPELARVLEPEPQTMKLRAVSRLGLSREALRQLGAL